MTSVILLHQIYFNALATTGIVALGYGFSKASLTRAYIGFLYLFALPIKLGVYYKTFPFLFKLEAQFSLIEKVYIVVPFLFFLSLEVLLFSKILNPKHPTDI